MADIISLDKKLKLTKEKKNALIRKRKLLAVRKTFQCEHCALKCVKCGIPVNEHYSDKDHDIQVTYRFCRECEEEYLDYCDRLEGKGNSDCYWHNQTWMNVWKTWIEHQAAKESYLKSKEFIQLTDEIKQTISEQQEE